MVDRAVRPPAGTEPPGVGADAAVPRVLAGRLALGTVDAQGAAMSAAEVLMLVVVITHLLKLVAPDHLPARLMMLGCAVLLVLYGRDLLNAFTGEYGPNDAWVNLDLSIGSCSISAC